jgi:hypothetical protein
VHDIGLLCPYHSLGSMGVVLTHAESFRTGGEFASLFICTVGNLPDFAQVNGTFWHPTEESGVTVRRSWKKGQGMPFSGNIVFPGHLLHHGKAKSLRFFPFIAKRASREALAG